MRLPRWMSLFCLEPSLTAAPVAAKGCGLAEQSRSIRQDISAGGSFKRCPPCFAAVGGHRSEDRISSRISFPMPHHGMPAQDGGEQT